MTMTLPAPNDVLLRKRRLGADDVVAASNDPTLRLPTLKKVCREPLSPTSVGEFHGGTTTSSIRHGSNPPPLSLTVTSSTSLGNAGNNSKVERSASVPNAKIQSVIRGLDHVSKCRHGCKNPLCISTRGFIKKVTLHVEAMKQKKEHDSEKCGACQLWKGIVASHVKSCNSTECTIPMCGAVRTASTGSGSPRL